MIPGILFLHAGSGNKREASYLMLFHWMGNAGEKATISALTRAIAATKNYELLEYLATATFRQWFHDLMICCMSGLYLTHYHVQRTFVTFNLLFVMIDLHFCVISYSCIEFHSVFGKPSVVSCQCWEPQVTILDMLWLSKIFSSLYCIENENVQLNRSGRESQQKGQVIRRQLNCVSFIVGSYIRHWWCVYHISSNGTHGFYFFHKHLTSGFYGSPNTGTLYFTRMFIIWSR